MRSTAVVEKNEHLEHDHAISLNRCIGPDTQGGRRWPRSVVGKASISSAQRQGLGWFESLKNKKAG